MLRAGDQIGPYILISKLGRGAFGTVWLSERRTAIVTTTAALKIPLDDDIDLETIKHEANLWVRASGHPNVLPIIEANIYDDQIIIASEYAPDGSLESWLKQNGGKAPSVEAAAEIISGVLAGLEHLHSRNIIHRDLKPANILFQGSTPRLADFGISRVLKSTSQSSIVAGTPAYMAPEAFDGKRSAQTDVWSVGVIFYQLLGGRLPFPQTDITSLVGAILSRNPDPLPNSIPEPLQEVINRALSKETTKRYKSAAEMRSALRKAAEAKVKREYTTKPVIATLPARPVNDTPSPSALSQAVQLKSTPRFIYVVAALGVSSIIIIAIIAFIASSNTSNNNFSSNYNSVNVNSNHASSTGSNANQYQADLARANHNSSTNYHPRKDLISIVNDQQTPEGILVTILSKVPLDDYSSYIKDDWFYVVIPNSDVPSEQRMAVETSAFSENNLNNKSRDLIVSFHLKPGVIPRVNQKSTKLEILFDTRNARN